MKSRTGIINGKRYQAISTVVPVEIPKHSGEIEVHNLIELRGEERFQTIRVVQKSNGEPLIHIDLNSMLLGRVCSRLGIPPEQFFNLIERSYQRGALKLDMNPRPRKTAETIV